MIPSIVFGVFSVLFCVLFCSLRCKEANVLSLGIKTISSVCFFLSGIFAIEYVGSSGIRLLVLSGLVFGLIGDIFLDLRLMYPEKHNEYLIVGTTSFSVGHLFYFIALCFLNSTSLHSHLLWNILISFAVGTIFTLGIGLFGKKLGLNFGNLIYMVLIYSFALSFLTAFSISIAIFLPILWIFAGGAILFLASDLVLSLQIFGNKTSKSLIWINHILYYLAQVLIAISILFI